MKRPRSTLAALAALTALAAPTLAGLTGPAAADQQTTPRATAAPTVRVMTQNLYVGADITRPLAAAQGLEDFEDIIVAVAHENDAVHETMQQTDFRGTRSWLLARQIADTRADLVGLQEVALLRTGPLELQPGALLATNATEVDADYLKILLHRLRQLGVPYRAVQVTKNADVEAPAFQGDPYAEPSTVTDGRDLRVTDRDVILRRVGSRVEVLKDGGARYDTALTLDLGGVSFTVPRGYGWVSARIDGRRFRFVNTHLEAFSSDIALGQAEELYADGGPLDTAGNVVFLGDINSDPLDDTVHDGSAVPHSAAYDALVAPGGGGVFDEWLLWRPAEDGWTSGLSETVDDETADGFDHRIDVIFARNSKGKALTPLGGRVVGTDLSYRDADTGLWPSDHGGVFLRLRGLRR